MAVTQTQAQVELVAATQASVELVDVIPPVQGRAAVSPVGPADVIPPVQGRAAVSPVGPADVIPPVQGLAAPADVLLPNGPVERKAVALTALVLRAVITLDLVAAAGAQH